MLEYKKNRHQYDKKKYFGRVLFSERKVYKKEEEEGHIYRKTIDCLPRNKPLSEEICRATNPFCHATNGAKFHIFYRNISAKMPWKGLYLLSYFHFYRGLGPSLSFIYFCLFVHHLFYFNLILVIYFTSGILKNEHIITHE